MLAADTRTGAGAAASGVRRRANRLREALQRTLHAERFERAYRRVWGALHRADDPDLSQHERQLLHHIPEEGGVALTWLAHHLALPKSSASVLVKDLARRGFVERARDPGDERRLAIVLTGKGRRRVRADSVLEPRPLARALEALPARRRQAMLRDLEELARAAEKPPHRSASAE